MASAATRGADRANRDRVIEPEGDEKGNAPEFLDGLVTGEFPTIKGRGRPGKEMDATLAAELLDSLGGKTYARRTWPVKSRQNEQNRIKAWGLKQTPALKPDFVAIHTVDEKVTVGIRMKVAPVTPAE